MRDFITRKSYSKFYDKEVSVAVSPKKETKVRRTSMEDILYSDISPKKQKKVILADTSNFELNDKPLKFYEELSSTKQRTDSINSVDKIISRISKHNTLESPVKIRNREFGSEEQAKKSDFNREYTGLELGGYFNKNKPSRFSGLDYILEAERKVDSKESTDKTSSNSPVKLRKKVTVVEEDITSGALIPNRTAEKRKSDRSAIKSNHDRKYSAPEVLKEVKKEKKKGSFRLEVSDYNKSYEKLVLFINDCLDETRTLNV